MTDAMKEHDIPVYSLKDKADEITEPGVIILSNHCLVLLPKTDENEKYASLLMK